MATTDNRQPTTAPSCIRRKYIIKPSFQWKYTALAASGVFMVSVLMSLLLFGVLYQQARTRMINPAASNAWQNTVVVAVSGASFAAVMAVVFGLWSVVITHRICGPLFVMEKFFGELIAGRFPRRRPLRKKDEFKEFYEVFWRAIDALKARKRCEAAKLADVLALAKEAQQGDDKARTQALETLTEHVQAMHADAAEALGVEHPSAGAAAEKSPASRSQAGKELAEVSA
ncbi:MAG: hypothetical protein V3W34_16480 [Phycisphaerae bacterium]